MEGNSKAIYCTMVALFLSLGNISMMREHYTERIVLKLLAFLIAFDILLT